MTSPTGLLYSQIGYDLGQPKRVVVRGPSGTVLVDAAFSVERADSGQEVFAASIKPRGAM